GAHALVVNRNDQVSVETERARLLEEMIDERIGEGNQRAERHARRADGGGGLRAAQSRGPRGAVGIDLDDLQAAFLLAEETSHRVLDLDPEVGAAAAAGTRRIAVFQIGGNRCGVFAGAEASLAWNFLDTGLHRNRPGLGSEFEG